MSDCKTATAATPELTVLFDGGCPLCVREVTFLRQRDQQRNRAQPRLAFIDIDSADYAPDDYQGISYREAMGRIHGIDASGAVLKDLAVFRRAYALIGLGWLYTPSGWPLLAQLSNGAYGLWARWRLRITGRPSLDQLCQDRCNKQPAS